MKIGPKFKIAKRLGAPIFPKTQTPKFANSVARPGRPRKGRPSPASDYKKQLLEKQKMRFTYGLSERQFRTYVEQAMKTGHRPIAALFAKLESRLDNIVYRLGIAKTRAQARQLVVHGHVVLNGKKLNVPSAHVRIGDIITIREGSKNIGLLANFTEQHSMASVPAWLTFDVKKISGEKKQEPTFAEKESLFDPELVLEYYSR